MSDLSGQSNIQQIRSNGLGMGPNSSQTKVTQAQEQANNPKEQAIRMASNPRAGQEYMANMNKYLISRNSSSLRIRPNTDAKTQQSPRVAAR